MKSPTFKADADVRRQQTSEYLSVKTARNRAYALTGFLALVAACEALALYRLTPLKTVEPVIVTVDSATGHVSKIETADPRQLNANEAVRQTELHDYVLNRNTLDTHNRQLLSDLVRLHSATNVAEAFDQEMSANNPNNPYYKIGEGARRIVDVTRISLLDDKTAQVKYMTHTQRLGRTNDTEYWVATISFMFTAKPLNLRDRWENPLGFVVTAYRNDRELSNAQTSF